MLRLGRLLGFVLAAGAVVSLQGEPASGFAIDKSSTFLGGVWSHGDESDGVHEPITWNAVRRGMPGASDNLKLLMWAGVENVDVTHHFDSEYHFDSASVSRFPQRFEKAFAEVDKKINEALRYANGNPEFFKPSYQSYRQIVAAVPAALLALARHQGCDGCATIRLRARAAEAAAALVYLAPNANPDPHAPTNPDSVFALFNPLKSTKCGLCGAGWGINKGYRLNIGEVTAALDLGVNESKRLKASDPVRKRVERLGDAFRAYLAFQELGHAFHATQDFFAHTNYVELMAGVPVETRIPAGTRIPVPQSRAGFTMNGIAQIMGAERFQKLESGAANAIWLGESDYCLGSLYNPKTRTTFKLPTLKLPGVGKVGGGQLTVTPGGTNPLPPEGLNYCHYHTAGAPGLNKDEPGNAEPSHTNHAIAVQAATDMTAVLWKSFLLTVKRPPKPEPDRAAPNLAGTWKGQDGGLFVLKQAKGSKEVSWEGCSPDGGKTWTHTFTGRIVGDSLVGRFKDHPPGQLRNEGDLALDIAGDGKLVWIAKLTVDGKTYTSFPTFTRTWTRAKHGGCPTLSSTPPAGWTGDWTWHATNDVTGNAFEGRMTIVQQGDTVCSEWSFSGGGSAKGGLSGSTWSGARWYDRFGQGTWTLTLSPDGKTFNGSQTITRHFDQSKYTATIEGTRTSSTPSQKLDCSTLKVGP